MTDSIPDAIPEPAVWHPALFGSGRYGYLADGRKVVELPAIGSVPAYRFIDAKAAR